ncbi:hypothetical protein Tco_0895767 [Tanacetum coccineum]|uniref:Uncharacterized protein n=1 Tax=Tanacetum coccineum TaxID=301880 RepID=A0ABQ5CFJ3_9ASTR
MENTLALNYKLDELIESLKSLPKKTIEEDLAKHKYHEQQDLGFENANFESQALSSFDVYTPHVTDPKEVEETIGIPMEAEPFDQTQLEDVGLNTSSHDLFLSSREIPSFDEPVPQLLPRFSPLDVNLRDKRGTDPPINPYNPVNFKMKSFLQENEARIFTDPGDGVQINSDGVTSLQLYLMRRSFEVLRSFIWTILG